MIKIHNIYEKLIIGEQDGAIIEVTGVEVWAERRRKRGWLEEEMRAGSGGGGGGIPGDWMDVEAEMERERLESFLEEKADGKSAELGKWRMEGEAGRVTEMESEDGARSRRKERVERRRWRVEMAPEAEGKK